MAVYTPSPIMPPQFISTVADQLVFSPLPAPAVGLGGTLVPANFNFQIAGCRISNIYGAPVAVTLWRVPDGSANDNEHVRIPKSVKIPPATQGAPYFEVSIFAAIVLRTGDSIWAQADTPSALIIDADGVMIGAV